MESRPPEENEHLTEAESTPEWLDKVLRTARRVTERAEQNGTPSPEYCDRIGDIAFALAQLRSAAKEVRFNAVPLSEFLAALARSAGLDLSPIYDWFGIVPEEPTTPESVSPWCRLAKRIGINVSECLARVRAGFALRSKRVPRAALSFRARGEEPSTTPLDSVNHLLESVEANYDSRLTEELNRLKQAVRTAYSRNQDVRRM